MANLENWIKSPTNQRYTCLHLYSPVFICIYLYTQNTSANESPTFKFSRLDFLFLLSASASLWSSLWSLCPRNSRHSFTFNSNLIQFLIHLWPNMVILQSYDVIFTCILPLTSYRKSHLDDWYARNASAMRI